MTKTQNNKLYDEVKKRIALMSVIRGYGFAPKQESDGLFTMSCPFHNEKTPSFKIYEHTNSFYCFGCGAGGSVVDFMALQENRSKQSVLDQFKDSIDVTSNKFAIDTLSNVLQKSSVDGNKYRQDMHFEMRVYLREWLKKHEGKEDKVDECFREMRMFFFNTDNTDEKIIKKFSEYIIKKVKE